MWFVQGVTCPPASTWFILEPHRTKREVCSNTICNAPNYWHLDGSYSMALHAVTLHSTFLLVRTHHRSKYSIGSPFRDLDNLLGLLLGSMTICTNQHKTFQRALSSFTHFMGNFLEGHPIHTCSKPSTLNCGILKWWATEKYMHLVGINNTN